LGKEKGGTEAPKVRKKEKERKQRGKKLRSLPESTFKWPPPKKEKNKKAGKHGGKRLRKKKKKRRRDQGGQKNPNFFSYKGGKMLDGPLKDLSGGGGGGKMAKKIRIGYKVRNRGAGKLKNVGVKSRAGGANRNPWEGMGVPGGKETFPRKKGAR